MTVAPEDRAWPFPGLAHALVGTLLWTLGLLSLFGLGGFLLTVLGGLLLGIGLYAVVAGAVAYGIHLSRR